MADEKQPAPKPAAAKKPAVKAPVEAPEHWQRELNVTEPLHAAVMVTGGWNEASTVARDEYEAAMNRYPRRSRLMARGRTEVRDLDGGLGYTGPDGAAIYAVMGVGSKALSVADQRPIIVTSANDVADLIGEGPLRDALVFQLTTTGGTVLAMPLVRSTGGSVLVAAASSGALAVTAVGGYAFGQQKVRLECTLGGAAGTATFRLIVDGVPAVAFTPAAAAFAAAIVLTASQLGSLATGVLAADYFAPTMTTNAAFVAGAYVEFQMGEPKAAAADIAPAITKLADTKTLFEWIEIAGVTAPATWALGQTAVRLLRDRGRYVGLHVQAAGPDLLTGASAAVTVPAWVSALIQATVPPRLMAPRLHVWPFHVTMRDPFRNVNRVIPSLYPAVAHMAALEPWEPPDAVEYGALERVIDVYPGGHLRRQHRCARRRLVCHAPRARGLRRLVYHPSAPLRHVSAVRHPRQ